MLLADPSLIVVDHEDVIAGGTAGTGPAGSSAGPSSTACPDEGYRSATPAVPASQATVCPWLQWLVTVYP
jgi:hypothetical protein